MSGGWAFVWMFVVLKIPIAALLGLVWWATRPVPAPDAGSGDGGGNDRALPRHPRGPRRPGPSRRGPHGVSPPPSPSRMRIARGRRLGPAHRRVG